MNNSKVSSRIITLRVDQTETQYTENEKEVSFCEALIGLDPQGVRNAIEAKCDVNKELFGPGVMKYTKSPLLWAVEPGASFITSSLLRPVEPSVINSNRVEVIELLLAAKANPTVCGRSEYRINRSAGVLSRHAWDSNPFEVSVGNRDYYAALAILKALPNSLNNCKDLSLGDSAAEYGLANGASRRRKVEVFIKHAKQYNDMIANLNVLLISIISTDRNVVNLITSYLPFEEENYLKEIS